MSKKCTSNGFKTQRNELLGAWIAKVALMELDRAASYMQYFVAEARKYENTEDLARFIQDEMRSYDNEISQSLAIGMIENYGQQVRDALTTGSNQEGV